MVNQKSRSKLPAAEANLNFLHMFSNQKALLPSVFPLTDIFEIYLTGFFYDKQSTSMVH